MEPVAIVGLSALFPEASGVREYWENVVAGRDCIVDVPPSRWSVDDHYDPDPAAPDRTYCRTGGFIPDVEFDPLEWGLPPNTLEITDVAQLLSLVLAKHAFADAGCFDREDAFDRERTGVILGVGGGQKLITPLTSRLQEPVWRRALETSGVSGADADLIVEKIAAAYVRWEEDSFPGLLGNVIAGRIANRFDLGGINCVVDAACASSFAALRMAVGELTDHRADMMLTGGVDADNSAFMYLCFSKTPAFSPSNRIRPFDAASDGMLVGEGLGMLVLKRFEDARRDGDRVYAVIRGLGASSDGRYKSIYAPRTDGQVRALRRAYASAGIEPASIGLVEAHGTGTVAGDLCELEALRLVLGADGAEMPASVALGSVKSQIGHTKAAAGAAGLIKTALALHHKVLPPTINVDRPHPALGLDGSPLYLNVEARPWLRRAPDLPRCAGVSAFGFGGTNFHVVLEECEPEQTGRYRLHGSTREVLVSAASPSALVDRCHVLADEVVAGGDVSDLVDSGAEGVPDDAARVGFVAGDAEECAELLLLAAERIGADPEAEAWSLPRGIHYRRRSLGTRGRVAALFPGQGSQYVGMGRALALSFPPVRDRLAACDALFRAAGDAPLSETVYPPAAFDDAERAAQEDRLRDTARAQPAIGTQSAAMFALLRDAGFEPDFAAGHSFGELTALWAAGAMDEEAFLRLARERGRALAVPPGVEAGSMLAVSGAGGQVEAAIAGLADVIVANVNAPDQTVVAGPSGSIAEARRRLSELGYATTPLPVSAAFHTPLVAHGHAPFAAAVESVEIRPPRIPVVSTATAEPYPGEPQAIAAKLSAQLAQPVHWQRQVETLYAAGARVFVEIGPRGVLTGLVRRILGDRPHAAVTLDGGPGDSGGRQLREAVVQLRVLGVRLGELDRYRRPPAPAPALGRRPGAGMNIPLNGANYVSEKTRESYAATLARELPFRRDDKESIHVSSNGSGSGIPSMPPLAGQTAPGSGDALERLHAHQQELLRLQTTLVTGQLELSRSLLELVAASPEGTARSGLLEAMQRQQAATLQQHEQFVAGQVRYAEMLLATIDPREAPGLDRAAARAGEFIPVPAAPASAAPALSPPAAVVTRPPVEPVLDVVPEQLHADVVPVAAATPTASASGLAELQDAMLEVVSEKTGYPVETLELDMDIEADLGIDSIKRVEILGAMQARFADLPVLRPEELGALHTLREVVDYLRRFESPAPAPAAAQSPPSSNGGVALGKPGLRTLPPPDSLEGALPAGYSVLLTDDGTAITTTIARELLAAGSPTVVLRLPEIATGHIGLPEGAADVALDSFDEGRIRQVVEDIVTRHGPIGAFVHVHPRGPRPGFVEPEQEQLLRCVFLAATHLRASLTESARLGRGSFVVVTRLDGALGTGNGDFDPAGGGLYGLVKTIRQEWPGVFCRAVDLAPTLDPDAAAHAVLAELADPDERLVEVAYGARGRVTLGVEDLVTLGG